MNTFIDDLIAESEVRDKEYRLQMNKLRADQVLTAIMVLEEKLDEVNKLTEDEIKIIEAYAYVERERLGKKISWLSWQLEQFMKNTNEKTINLPHGVMKFRLGREKLEVTDLEKFLPIAERKGFLRMIPESKEPDLQKLAAHLKAGGILPPGVSLIPAQTKFSYKTLKGLTNGNGKTESAENGSESE